MPATAVSTATLTSDLQVTAPASGMSVLISAGQAYVSGTLGTGSGSGTGIGYGYPVITTNGTSAPTIAANAHATPITLTSQGVYYCYNDNTGGVGGKASLTITTSDPTNPRIDIVGVLVEDAFYSGSNNDWKFSVKTGSAASSPTVPTLFSNFLPLALVWVPANSSNVVSGNIIDLRVNYNRNPIKARMYRAAAFTSTASAYTTPTFDTIDYDLTNSMSLTSGFTAPISGLYLCHGLVTFAINSSATLGTCQWFKNGATVVRSGAQVSSTATSFVSCADTSIISLNAGDVLAFQYYIPATIAGETGSSFSFYEITLLSSL